MQTHNQRGRGERLLGDAALFLQAFWWKIRLGGLISSCNSFTSSDGVLYKQGQLCVHLFPVHLVSH